MKDEGKQANTVRRVGIFSGTFDPVHKGHISFALSATRVAKLDKVYFVPETKPRYKEDITHITHRLAMLELATRPHKKLKTLQLPDKQFNVRSTWPRLKQKFPDEEILLLMGSDVFEKLPGWPLFKTLLHHTGLVIGVRSHHETLVTLEKANKLGPLRELHVIESDQPTLASRDVRRDILTGKENSGLLTSVERYISKNWLYSSPSG